MPRICDLIARLKVNQKVYKNPQWWNSKRQITKEVKRHDIPKQNINLKASYRVANSPMFDSFEKYQHKVPEYAPWNSVFRKSETIILMDKKK
jgi:hypothetical protein